MPGPGAEIAFRVYQVPGGQGQSVEVLYHLARPCAHHAAGAFERQAGYGRSVAPVLQRGDELAGGALPLPEHREIHVRVAGQLFGAGYRVRPAGQHLAGRQRPLGQLRQHVHLRPVDAHAGQAHDVRGESLHAPGGLRAVQALQPGVEYPDFVAPRAQCGRQADKPVRHAGRGQTLEAIPGVRLDKQYLHAHWHYDTISVTIRL